MFQRFISAQVRFGAIILCIVLSTVGGLALAKDPKRPPLPVNSGDGLGWPLIHLSLINPHYGILGLEEMAINGFELENPKPGVYENFSAKVAENFHFFMGQERLYLSRLKLLVSADDLKIRLLAESNIEMPWIVFEGIAKDHKFLFSAYHGSLHLEPNRKNMANYVINQIAEQYFEARKNWKPQHPQMVRAEQEIPHLIDMLFNPTPQMSKPEEFRKRTEVEAHRDARIKAIEVTGVDPNKSESEVVDLVRLRDSKDLYDRYYREMTKADYSREKPYAYIPPFEETKKYVLERLRSLLADAAVEFLQDFPEGTVFLTSGKPLDYQQVRANILDPWKTKPILYYHPEGPETKHKGAFTVGHRLPPRYSGETNFLRAIFNSRIMSSIQYYQLEDLVSKLSREIRPLKEEDLKAVVTLEDEENGKFNIRSFRNKMNVTAPNTESLYSWETYNAWFEEIFQGSYLGGFRFGLMSVLSAQPDYLEKQARAEEQIYLPQFFEPGFNASVDYYPDRENNRSKQKWREYIKQVTSGEARVRETVIPNIVKHIKVDGKSNVKTHPIKLTPTTHESKKSLVDSLFNFERQKLGAGIEPRDGGWSLGGSAAAIQFSHLHFNTLYLYSPNPNQQFEKLDLGKARFHLYPLSAKFIEPTKVRNGVAELYIPVGYELRTIQVKSAEGKILDPSQYTIEVGKEDSGLRLRLQDPTATASITYRLTFSKIPKDKMSNLEILSPKEKIHELAQFAEEARLTELSEMLLVSPPKTGADLEKIIKASTRYTEDPKKLVESVQMSDANPFKPLAPYIREPYLLGVCVEHNDLLEKAANNLDLNAQILPYRKFILAQVLESKLKVDAFTHAAVLFREPGKEVSVLDGTSNVVIDSQLWHFWRNSVSTVKHVGTMLSSKWKSFKFNTAEKKPKEEQVKKEQGKENAAADPTLANPEESPKVEAKSEEVKVVSKAVEPQAQSVKEPELIPEDALDKRNPQFVAFVEIVHSAWTKYWEFYVRTKNDEEVISQSDNPTRSLKVLSGLLHYLSGSGAHQMAFQDVQKYFRIDKSKYWSELQWHTQSLDKQFTYLHDNFKNPQARIQKSFPFLTLSEIQTEHNYLYVLASVLKHPIFQKHAADLPKAIQAFLPLMRPCESQLVPPKKTELQRVDSKKGFHDFERLRR